MRDEKGENEFHVVVGDQKLEEIRHSDGQTYIQMLLFSKVSYGVEFTEEVRGLGAVEHITQKWPVSPYTVAVRNTSQKANFAQLYVDGRKIAEKYVGPESSVIFEGIPTEEGIQELLFSLPRYTTLREKDIGGKSLPEAVLREIGTIKVVWRDCVKTGRSRMDNYRPYLTTSNYHQANKDDAKAAGGAGVTEKFASTTRAGKVVGLNEAKACIVSNYEYTGEPWSETLLYRTKEYLVEIGVLKPDVDPEEEEKRKKKRKIRQEKRFLKEAATGGGAFVPPPVPVCVIDEPGR